jgi:hypothetical protein
MQILQVIQMIESLQVAMYSCLVEHLFLSLARNKIVLQSPL